MLSEKFGLINKLYLVYLIREWKCHHCGIMGACLLAWGQ